MHSDQPPKRRGFPTRLAALLGGSLLLIAAVSLINLSPTLSNLDAQMASGPESGNYFAIAKRLEAAAAAREGHLENQATRGTVDNLQRLIAAREMCDLSFAMVQDGISAPLGHQLQLIARLPKSESVFILGPGAASLRTFIDMQRLRVGIGPSGSGTDHLARDIFESRDFAPLKLQLSNHSLNEQLTKLANGTLDLAVFVLDEDATLIRDAMRSGMQMASFEHLDVIARHFDFISHGRIGAGQYDPIAIIPPEDRYVLRVDTLVVGNGCASRTETIALLSLLQRQFPTLLQHNRDSGASAFFATASASHSFMMSGGPEWADTHVAWLVDIMPISNWFYVIMGISILFNAMTGAHKFRLWRLDVRRVRAEQVFRDILGAQLTPSEVRELQPRAEHLEDQSISKIDAALQELNRLRLRCRRQEQSALVPMGQELAYRYQEEQIEITLTALRAFRLKIDQARSRTRQEIS